MIHIKLIPPLSSLLNNRELIWEMSKKQIRDQYKGQPLGVFWAVFHPFVLIAIYVFLFGVVYQTRIGGEDAGGTLSYTSYILSGMIPWLCIQTSLGTGANSIVSNSVLVKQVIFPIEVLPVKTVTAAFIIEFIYLGFDMLYTIISSQRVLLTYALLPLALVLQYLCLIGLVFALSSLTVYLRDIKDIVLVLCQIGVYLMPIIYLPENVPALFRKVLYINPFSHYIWVFQDILYFGKVIHPVSWWICLFLTILSFYFGNHLFWRLKTGFGSVL